MRWLLLFLFLLVCGLCQAQSQMDAYEDNDFAEFEDFDTDDDFACEGCEDSNWKPAIVSGQQGNVKSKSGGAATGGGEADDAAKGGTGQGDGRAKGNAKSDDFVDMIEDDDEEAIVEDEDSEFEHFQDEEEFEGFDSGDVKDNQGDQKTGEPTLTMIKVPMHFRTHWDSYWMEMLMIAGLTTYFANFFFGKGRNAAIANMWLNTHRSLLEENFVLVGDDGKLENESPGLMKESENVYTLWCSGRTCCEGMLVELRMIRRQDLVALVSKLMRPVQDQVHIKIEISKESMDSFVFCVASKKTATKLFKEMSDLSKFCSLVNKPDEKYNVPSGFSVLSEIPEATSTMLDSRVLAALNKVGHLIDYIHISDQFSGPIQQEDPNNLKQPEVKKMLMAGFNLPKSCDMESAKTLLILIFYIMERLKRFRLSKEGKAKSDKNRLRVEEAFLKSTHAARAEAAAQRREDKRKQEKERVMAEDDPEKQRRWEQKEQKRQAKKKAPKMKRLAVKSL